MNTTSTDIPNELRGTATAVIIGRAGSKGLPGKNAARLAGQPMIHFSIEAAKKATTVGRILVSTDSPEIAAAARTIDGVTVIDRPADLAGDTATVDAAVRHAVQENDSEIIVILYANVPIRPAGLIDRAVSCRHDTDADSVQSYASVGKYHPFWESRIDDAGRVTPYAENTIYRRQDLPPLFIPDGGVIVVTRASLFNVVEGEPHAFLGRDRRGIMNEPGEVIDIDTSIDLVVAEAILNRQDAPAMPTITNMEGLCRADR